MPVVNIFFSDKSKEVFYSGETLSGTIVLENEKSSKVENISLTFEGFAKVRSQEKITNKFLKNYNSG